MANTLSNPTKIARMTVRAFENELVMARNVFRGYESEWGKDQNLGNVYLFCRNFLGIRFSSITHFPREVGSEIRLWRAHPFTSKPVSIFISILIEPTVFMFTFTDPKNILLELISGLEERLRTS